MSIQEHIRRLILASGADKVGFSAAALTDEADDSLLGDWLRKGHNADMDYMANNSALRRNPSELLTGAKTVISILYNYYPAELRDESLPHIAMYAYGKDYHDVIRKRLKPVVKYITEECGHQARICVDSAPVRERYWARKAGLGFIGRNGLLITDEFGSYCFIAEVITTLQLEVDKPDVRSCLNCGKCIEACPTNAIQPDSTIDSHRCLSYLTIEHRGEWSAEQEALVSSSHTLFGCDICQTVCPHNAHPVTATIDEFRPTQALLQLTADNIPTTHEKLIATFPGSPLKRAKADGLIRNAFKRHK